MASIEKQYQARLAAMTGTERIARSSAMLQWTRDMIARQVVAAMGPVSDERVKWEVALRLYGQDERVRVLIERKITDVSS